jgi:hypothetical protein
MLNAGYMEPAARPVAQDATMAMDDQTHEWPAAWLDASLFGMEQDPLYFSRVIPGFSEVVDQIIEQATSGGVQYVPIVWDLHSVQYQSNNDIAEEPVQSPSAQMAAMILLSMRQDGTVSGTNPDVDQRGVETPRYQNSSQGLLLDSPPALDDESGDDIEHPIWSQITIFDIDSGADPQDGTTDSSATEVVTECQVRSMAQGIAETQTTKFQAAEAQAGETTQEGEPTEVDTTQEGGAAQEGETVQESDSTQEEEEAISEDGITTKSETSKEEIPLGSEAPCEGRDIPEAITLERVSKHSQSPEVAVDGDVLPPSSAIGNTSYRIAESSSDNQAEESISK